MSNQPSGTHETMIFIYHGRDIVNLVGPDLKAFRRNAQLIFQDPYGSLNPRMRVEDIVAEPLEVHGLGRSRRDRRDKVAALLETVGLAAGYFENGIGTAAASGSIPSFLTHSSIKTASKYASRT